MTISKPNLETTHNTASHFFLITVVLFVAFFVFEQDIFYTVNSQGHTFTQGETSSISHGGGIEKQVAVFALFIFSIFILINKRRSLYVFRDPISWLLLANLSWAMMSIFWADNPTITGRRIGLFFIIYFSAFAISMNIRLRRFPAMIIWLTAPVVIVGVIAERILGTWWFGWTWSSMYRFAGTQHPEGQAINCSMLFLAAATMTGKGGRFSRIFFTSVMILAIFFLALTKSRAPFIATIIAFGIYKLCTIARSTLAVYSYSIVIILGIVVLVFGNALAPLLISGVNLGRQETLGGLSGRTLLWEELSEYVMERPFIGYGFRGFWTEDRVLAISDSHGWRIRSSHSIYVDTALNVGLVGLGIFLTLVIVACWRAWRMCVDGGDEGGAFALSLIALWMADGIFASLVLGSGLVTFLLMMVLFGVSRESQLQRARGVVANDR